MQEISLATSVWTYNLISRNFCVIFFEIYWKLFEHIVSDDEMLHWLFYHFMTMNQIITNNVQLLNDLFQIEYWSIIQMLRNLKVNLKSDWLEVWLHERSSSDFKSSDTFMREALRSFESMRRDIRNNICCDEMTTFDECNRDSNSIRSVYKSFQSARLQNEREM